MKFFNVHRFNELNGIITDHGTVEIPERDLAETLSRNPLWKVETEVRLNVLGTVTPPLEVEKAPDPIVEPEEEEVNDLQCPLCGKQYESVSGLKNHKKKHYDNSNDRKV